MMLFSQVCELVGLNKVFHTMSGKSTPKSMRSPKRGARTVSARSRRSAGTRGGSAKSEDGVLERGLRHDIVTSCRKAQLNKLESLLAELVSD